MTKKLADSNTSSKKYWTILNRLLYNRKISTITPLFVDGKLATDLCKKANIFDNFFPSICTPIESTSCLPSFSYRTGSRIKSFHVTENDIFVLWRLFNMTLLWPLLQLFLTFFWKISGFFSQVCDNFYLVWDIFKLVSHFLSLFFKSLWLFFHFSSLLFTSFVFLWPYFTGVSFSVTWFSFFTSFYS